MRRAPPPGPGVMPTLQAAVAESVAGQQGGPDQPFRSAAHSLPGPRTIHECRYAALHSWVDRTEHGAGRGDPPTSPTAALSTTPAAR